MFKHFLQSEAWEAYEQTESHQTFRTSGEDYSFLAVKHATKIGNYLTLPYGPSLKADQSDEKVASTSLKNALKAIKALAVQEHCFFVRIEPTEPFKQPELEKLGLIKSRDIDPARTWCLRIDNQSEADILHGLSQGTRTRYNQFTKRGLSIEISKNSDDIRELTRLQHALAKEKGITPYSEAHLRRELEQPFASLYLVHYKDPDTNEEKIIAASLFFDDEANKTRFYMQSAADSTYKKLPATAGLLVRSILDAKKKGQKYFDFWGIAPENADESHPWYGFTQFKKSFGGFAVDYSGTYDLPLSKAKYSLYKKLRKINRLAHRI